MCRKILGTRYSLLRVIVYIHTFLDEMKDFLFQLNMNVKLRNLILIIIFSVLIEICFGFNPHNAQLSVVSSCFGYYLGKRRPLQVYVEINYCIFRFKSGQRNNKSDAKSDQKSDSNDSLLEKGLTTEKQFLQKSELFKKKILSKKLTSHIMLESAVCAYLSNQNLCQIMGMCLNLLS